jgi:hypothetical protein
MIKRHGVFVDYPFTPMTDEQQTELATEVADRIGEPLIAIDADLQGDATRSVQNCTLRAPRQFRLPKTFRVMSVAGARNAPV